MKDEDYHWHRRYHEKAINGYMGLTLEQRGAYTTLLDLMYDRGEPLLDNERLLAGYLNCSLRKYRTIRDQLIEMGKIQKTQNGKLTNSRFEKEREKDAKTSRTRSEAGKQGGKKSGEVRKKTNENNDHYEAKASANSEAKSKHPLSKVEEEKNREEYDSVSSTSLFPETESPTQKGAYAFCGEVIRLSHDDFEKWELNFSAIPDLRAELQARDDFLKHQPKADQKRWFMSTSSYLKNKNKQALQELRDRPQQQYAAGFQG